jgi:hypothetical protein
MPSAPVICPDYLTTSKLWDTPTVRRETEEDWGKGEVAVTGSLILKHAPIGSNQEDSA